MSIKFLGVKLKFDISIKLSKAENKRGHFDLFPFSFSTNSNLPTDNQKRLAFPQTLNLNVFYSSFFFASSNLAFMVGFPWVNFFMVKSSALLFASLKLFSEDKRASFVF